MQDIEIRTKIKKLIAITVVIVSIFAVVRMDQGSDPVIDSNTDPNTDNKKPSAADLDPYHPGIVYPLEQDYLDEYVHAVVVAPKGHSVFGYGTSGHDGTAHTVLNGEKVLVLAEHSGYSCVIVESTQKARWINSNYLKPEE